MAPAMPATMRGDGRGTKVAPQKPVARHFAGKGDVKDGAEGSDSESDSDAGEQESTVRAATNHRQEQISGGGRRLEVKQVDLSRYNEQARALESERLALEAAEADMAGSGSEYETEGSEDEASEEEEEEAPRRVLLKPTFIPKALREQQDNVSKAVSPSTATASTRGVACAPQDGQQAELDQLDEHQRRRLEARKLLEQQIRDEATARAQQQSSRDAEAAEVDDTDDVDPAAERAAWKLRELRRIKRERDAIEEREREREALEQRRALPEAERLAEDVERVRREREARLEEKRAAREEMGGSGAFAGRVHHQGGFYQDDPVTKRVLTGSLEDTQAGAGHRGATRWKGMAEQDTSRRDSAWNDGRDPGVKRTLDKMGGMKDTFASKKKRF